ncbi:hypothetical protein [Halostella sp. PRR32]|uniref:hypothetical protein n=1 Tax=Halostella sp. PRR32 TaxID=3098147 RepID=UPI002B1D0AD9|nr:hypothetical protein [Halostella sp. PRR32]
MPEQVSKLFTRLAELADAEGAVPEDGSGIDGTWTTTIPARDRDRDWSVAMNADVDEDHVVEDIPSEGDETTVQAGSATVWLGRWPAGVIHPFGGQVAAEQIDNGPQSIEDELIADIEARISSLRGDADV